MILSPFGLRIIGCIGILIALGGVYHHVWHNGYVGGAASVQRDWDADKAARIKAFSAMTEQWVVAASDAEKAIKERDDARQQRTTAAQARARTLPPAVAGVHIPGSAVSVLNDAIGDSTATSGTAAKPHEAAPGPAASADSTVGLLTQWGVTVIAMYDECRSRVGDWAAFYDSLRSAQGKPEDVKP